MTFEQLEQIVHAVSYKDWTLHLRTDDGSERHYLQWAFITRCVKTDRNECQWSRKWYLSPHMVESEVVGTAFKAAITAEEHECRESFTYAGRRIFNPHVSVRALMSVCDVEDVRP